MSVYKPKPPILTNLENINSQIDEINLFFTEISKRILVLEDSNIQIISGAISATLSKHTLTSETGGVADTLLTINGGFHGQVLVLSNGGTDDITIDTGGGNIELAKTGGDITMTDKFITATLIFDSNLAKWIEL